MKDNIIELVNDGRELTVELSQDKKSHVVDTCEIFIEELEFDLKAINNTIEYIKGILEKIGSGNQLNKLDIAILKEMKLIY